MRPHWLAGSIVGQYYAKLNEPSNCLEIKIKSRDWKQKPVARFDTMMLLDRDSGRPFYPLFYPDLSHPANQVASCIHRFGCSMPDPEQRRIDHFVEFAKLFIRTKIRGLVVSDVPTFDAWLDKCQYPGSRKRQLRKIASSIDSIDSKSMESKSFIKWEGYGEPKNPRAINSPDDVTKVLLGPYLWASDKRTFELPWFIKGRDPKTWPKIFEDEFGESGVMETDFSSFESHHRGKYCTVILYWLMHMLRDSGMSNARLRLVSQMVLGANVTKFKSLSAVVNQRLMSGVMWTSSANGLLNLLLMIYLVASSEKDWLPPSDIVRFADKFRGKVEGDDGLCVVSAVDTRIIAELGLKLKFELKQNYRCSSFCGTVMTDHPGDMLRDPIKTLRNFFVIPPKYARSNRNTHLALFRAKALSLKYQYNNCPIVGELCQWVCDNTRGITISDGVQSEISHHLVAHVDVSQTWRQRPTVHAASRQLVEDEFGIPITQQLYVERLIRESRAHILLPDLGWFTGVDREHMLNMTYEKTPPCLDHVVIPEPVNQVLENGRKTNVTRRRNVVKGALPVLALTTEL